jgi:hypothetical protein
MTRDAGDDPIAHLRACPLPVFSADEQPTRYGAFVANTGQTMIRPLGHQTVECLFLSFFWSRFG